MPTLYGSAVWETNGTVLPSLCGNGTVMQEPASSEILAGILLSDETHLVAVGPVGNSSWIVGIGTIFSPAGPTGCGAP
jgi:hypothetical protein